MTQRPLNQGASDLGSNVLRSIREDMEVYDRDGKHVGEVEQVYFGASSEGANATGTGAASVDDPTMRDRDSIIDFVARAFADDDDDMPETLRNRLLHEGFIRVEGDGLFASDRYVLPDQIASVTGDSVRLRVTRGELLKE